LFEAGVVVGGNAGEAGDFFAAEAGYAADASVGGQAGAGGVDLAAGSPQEIGEFLVGPVHGVEYPQAGAVLGWTGES
jgi:hypothetical protein